ncbi:molybdopterin-synthase adenylyltransferase MoeB [Plesiomonas sp. ZOR0011]|uniref:molybdopterin-synthase adenylyltransferase MoeB n=1 Tax=Plesiomonas sp. ZOR0011 TaxID=1339230 RepID=UPI00068AD2A1|nr:molybdopterin-synthase adenylyltransferase MoeB [Plesiomonas sp. ZOR0011]
MTHTDANSTPHFPSVTLSHEEELRYNRQIVLRECDFAGQEALKGASVLIVGLGGLGCAAAQYLAAAGIGHLTLLDFDHVSLSNLQRQILHTDARIGQAKVTSAAQSLQSINPYVQLTPICAQLEDDDLSALIAQQQIVLDCTDNAPTRNQLNRLCAQHRVPLVSGAAIRMEGQVSVFTYAPGTPCYRCLSRLFGEHAGSCMENGILSPVVGLIGSLQATECIKLLTGMGTPLTGRLLLVDARMMQFREMKLNQNPQCDVCGGNAPR